LSFVRAKYPNRFKWVTFMIIKMVIYSHAWELSTLKKKHIDNIKLILDIGYALPNFWFPLIPATKSYLADRYQVCNNNFSRQTIYLAT